MKLSEALHQKSKLEYESDKIYKWLCEQKESNMPKNDALLAAIEGVIADIDLQADELGARIEATIEGIDLKDCD